MAKNNGKRDAPTSVRAALATALVRTGGEADVQIRACQAAVMIQVKDRAGAIDDFMQTGASWQSAVLDCYWPFGREFL